jgi:hypothetical protein
MHSTISSSATGGTFSSKVAIQLDRARIHLLASFCLGCEQHASRIERAIDRALAIARETEFPHLLFPELATEMVRHALLRWVNANAHFRPKERRGNRSQRRIATLS